MVREGKVAIVTGAASGLGRAMARGLAAAGCRVTAMDMNIDALQAISDELWHAHGDGCVLPLAGDVGDPDVAYEIVARTVEAFGSLDVLVNNAGVGMGSIRRDCVTNPPGAFDGVSLDDWHRFLRVNTTGPYMMARAAVPHMRAKGGGRIVNVTTSLSTMLRHGSFPYGPSKAALESASAMWAAELKDDGITVNVLVPGGPTDTAMVTAENMPDRSVLLRPEVMVPPLLWYVSDEAAGFTGRRIIGQFWDASLPPAEAAEKVATPIGWPGVGAAAIWPGEPVT